MYNGKINGWCLGWRLGGLAWNSSTLLNLTFHNFFRQFVKLGISEKKEKKTWLFSRKIRRFVWNSIKSFFLPVWKNEKFTLTEKKFRQINYLVIKHEYLRSVNVLWTQCGKSRNSLPSKFFSVKSTYSKTLIWRNICEKTMAVKVRNFHSVRNTLRKIHFHQHFFFRQSNQLFPVFLVNELLSRNFCQKSVKVNFPNFHTAWKTVWEISNFPSTLILRENKFGHFETPKSAIW